MLFININFLAPLSVKTHVNRNNYTIFYVYSINSAFYSIFSKTIKMRETNYFKSIAGHLSFFISLLGIELYIFSYHVNAGDTLLGLALFLALFLVLIIGVFHVKWPLETAYLLHSMSRLVLVMALFRIFWLLITYKEMINSILILNDQTFDIEYSNPLIILFNDSFMKLLVYGTLLSSVLLLYRKSAFFGLILSIIFMYLLFITPFPQSFINDQYLSYNFLIASFLLLFYAPDIKDYFTSNLATLPSSYPYFKQELHDYKLLLGLKYVLYAGCFITAYQYKEDHTVEYNLANLADLQWDTDTLKNQKIVDYLLKENELRQH